MEVQKGWWSRQHRKFRVKEKSASQVNGRAQTIIAKNVLSCVLWYLRTMRSKGRRSASLLTVKESGL